jgi:hypothetical protein
LRFLNQQQKKSSVLNRFFTFSAAVAVICVAHIGVTPPEMAFAEIVFKKAKPKKNGGSRINIQITPDEDFYVNEHKKKLQKKSTPEEDEHGEAAVAVKPIAPADLQDWFWTANSPSIGEASSGRLDTAMQVLSANPGKAAKFSPNIAQMQELAEAHGGNILLATLGKDVSPAFVLAVIGVESGGRAEAVSGAGAVGLMQLIPDTAARFNVTDSTDPAQNIKGGTAYLDWLLKEFKRDPLLALAGYNAGEGAVRKHNGVPPYAETRAYVPKVVAAWQVARTLCMTPPKYVTDGCVFKSSASK